MGYGHFITYEGERQGSAHQFTYELLIGEVPKGLELDHLCRNRLCCNPTHLEPVTRRENLLRSPTIVARHAAQTHCIYGHLLDGENLYRWRNGRYCRMCRARRNKERVSR